MSVKRKIREKMKLTIQIVNFRSRHYLQKCLFSIVEHLPADLAIEIILVNNDGNPLEETLPAACSGLPVSVIEMEKNVGFGKAHNAAFYKAQGEYILFLNPDTRIPPEALSEMLDVFTNDDKIGIVGPLLVDSKGKVQPDCYGIQRTPSSMVVGKLLVQKRYNPSAENHIFEVDWVSGGAMLVRRDVFEKAGRFDENFFMYFEDVDLCRRVKKMGHRIAVNPAIQIFHESGKSFGSEREKKKYYYTSQNYYLRKHFGPVSAAAVRVLRFPYYVKNMWLK